MVEDLTKKSEIFITNGNTIRAFAIVLVIIFHAMNMFETLPTQNSIPYCGVSLFIMLSGALLLNPSKFTEPIGIFFRKRLNRIVLPFLFWGFTYLVWRGFYFNETLSLDTICRSFLGVGQGGDQYPYYHFWFLYMIIGLYLLTPILRTAIAYAGSKFIGFFICIWFIATTILPLLGVFPPAIMDSLIFLIPLFAGYFVLGAYFQTIHLNSKILYAFLILGFLWIFAYGWLAPIPGKTDPLLNINTILGSCILFLLLSATTVSERSIAHLKNHIPHVYGFIDTVGRYSFAIYFFHAIVLIVFAQQVLFRFSPNILTLNPVLGVTFLTLATLFICLPVIWALKKVPMLSKAIG
jgi:surface polysaccharide O-acyltransferase-like enzyme